MAYGVPKSIVSDNARDFRPGYFMNFAFDRDSVDQYTLPPQGSFVV